MTAWPPDERSTPRPRAFRATFGEELGDILDVGAWRAGNDLAQEYTRIEREVQDALSQEATHQRWIRRSVFPRLTDPALPGTGVFGANMDVIRLIHQGLLFNGGVEACDGTVHVHDTLPLTIYQIGVSLVSYRGDKGTWQQRLFRRDLRQQSGLPEEDMLRTLELRDLRAALNHDADSDKSGELLRKAVMDYAERAILLRNSNAVWRMGHGNPVTYELLTGADNWELMEAGTTAMRELIEKHRKFVYVASEPRERLLLSIGQALPPMHYAIIGRLSERIETWFHQKRFTLETGGDALWDGERINPTDWIPRFIREVASQVLVGLYRATRWAPAQLFYAHADHAHFAGHIVLADSMLQDQRGFPLLIDLADHVCRSVFGGSLRHMTETAYAAHGAPWRYFSERTTRDH